MISCPVPERTLPTIIDESNLLMFKAAGFLQTPSPMQLLPSSFAQNQPIFHNMVQIPPTSSPQNPLPCPSPSNFAFSPEYYIAALKQERDFLRSQKILSQFNGDYKITDNYVRINGSCVTFWMYGNESTEGKLTLKKFGSKLTVVLTADFNDQYVFYWTSGGDDYIEWTHAADFEGKSPIRWTKINGTQQKETSPRKRVSLATRKRHASHSSMRSSVTSERLDMSEAPFSMSSRERSPTNHLDNSPSNFKNHPHFERALYEKRPKTVSSPKKPKTVVNAQDHNVKQKMLCKTGFECIDKWADIVIDKVKALYLRNATKQQRECQDVKSILHNICDDIKPGLRGPCVFGIRAKKLGELENTIPFLKDMENIATFKKMSLIFNSKRKKVDGKSLKKRQKKTICIYVEVEDLMQVQEVLKRHKEKWSHLIAYCQIRNDEN